MLRLLFQCFCSSNAVLASCTLMLDRFWMIDASLSFVNVTGLFISYFYLLLWGGTEPNCLVQMSLNAM
jgi:hypothetical protein